ncbi:MAG: PAS domain S-box protein [Microcoleus sp. PH2017_10_PVI_O_A]|uniref:PAS domain S-box protein n=1 Tax=unclassified Microcoleus TaxID=2642155 RepID=UPI001D935B8C|nr:MULTISPECIES: PAS domain S-box protein [unclassified Microcoleus]TAE80314.1 MAG: PAS domain S-box protein [Oscillatoriales cyanobacterium]MCC3407646.1 PAS domain S-box protein [Microcoleus sp. PH2017_10_PVI_O_A]MCC3461852.1 PAS domain S-box protein [Microcoleus sp. PH2017_11_PCY_U_A]MCC3480238.1 PAS domain S-box protein [Microcoleus sp. PH2017_12_PCY_D_A]MCC3527568.1 PAS domain S-box protein [Microcoleus sp. PH2017_21_RUC_O_A]
MKTLNILLVEDSPLDAELIEAYLMDGGLDFSLLCVETREDFAVALEKQCVDIILADYMLPCFNGIAALEIARATCPGVPFIFVSATLGEEVAIETLKSGATDYVLKRRLTRLVPSIERALREVKERLARKAAQAQRQESEARFRMMADTAPVMIWMSDIDRLGDYFNKVWLEFTGKTLAQEIGIGWMESLHPDDLPKYMDVYRRAFDARSEYRIEYRLRRYDGEYRWVVSTGVPLYRPDRTFAGYIGSCIDISDRQLAEEERVMALSREQAARKQAEETAQALLSANARITNILESITDAFVAFDLNWNYTYINHKAMELLGKSQVELIGKNIRDIFPKVVDLQCYEMATQALAEKVTVEYEEFVPLLNKWLEVRFYPSDSGLSAYIQDVSDSKQAEAALKASQEKLRMLAESNLIGILFGDVDGGISEANDEFLRLVGYTREQLQRGELRWIDITPPEYLRLDEIGIAEAKAEGVCTPYEKEYIRPDGSRIPVLVGYILLGEKRQESVAFILDLTVRKELEKELHDRAEELARANRIKDEFLGTLSHELRTPLNAMLGWAQLLRYRKFDEKTTVKALETIDRNTRSLGTLIEDLLDVSQIMTGQLSLNLRWVDLISTVEGAIETLAPAIGAKNIEIVTDFDSSAGRIFGDSGRLQQVVWNLLSNAIKFTPDGGQVRVGLHKVERTSIPGQSACGENLSPPSVEIEVSDTGQGIRAEFLPHVFERFSQADSSATRSYNGLGLGLALVRHFVEMHGGTVQVESAGQGQGASFFVRLPIKQQEGDGGFSVAGAGEFVVRETPARSLMNESFVSSNLSGVRVLVVDGDGDSLDFARTVFEDCGAEVETAVSGMEALEAISRLNPDVLAIDLGIETADGESLLPQVRERMAHREIPAVAFTTYGRVEERVRALRQGFQIHVPKPLDAGELVAVVASLAARAIDF